MKTKRTMTSRSRCRNRGEQRRREKEGSEPTLKQEVEEPGQEGGEQDQRLTSEVQTRKIKEFLSKE